MLLITAIKHFLENSLKGNPQYWITLENRRKHFGNHANKLRKQLNDHLGLSLSQKSNVEACCGLRMQQTVVRIYSFPGNFTMAGEEFLELSSFLNLFRNFRKMS